MQRAKQLMCSMHDSSEETAAAFVHRRRTHIIYPFHLAGSKWTHIV